MQQQIIISNDIEHDLATAVAGSEHDRVFVLTDDTTHECCLPKVAALLAQYDAVPITIAHGDQHKTLAALGDVWTALQQGGATRHSLLPRHTRHRKPLFGLRRDAEACAHQRRTHVG